jgi:ferrous iron transport protein B
MTAQVQSLAPATPSGTTILLLGNPNVGKTTLFNALTGRSARVGNYPGITVDRLSGSLQLAEGLVELVDAPGTYSLSARSMEEQVAIEAALGHGDNVRPSLVLVVADAGQLTRNLYLAVQLVEFRLPVVLVLTMVDEVAERPPIANKVGALLSVDCVAVNPRRRTGLDELRSVISAALAKPSPGDVAIPYDSRIRTYADRVAEALPTDWRRDVEHDRALALWCLLSLGDDDELNAPLPVRERCSEIRTEAAGADFDLDLAIIQARYAFLEQRLPGCYQGAQVDWVISDWTERVDRFLLHPAYGLVFFLLLMLSVFQALFTWADPAIGLIESGVALLQTLATTSMPDGLIRDLVTEGLLGGVGNVVVFLPQILLLFFLIGLLEDSGYMARVAYLMDRVLRAVGLHGKAFVPMLSGLACAVPAILATRTMERRRDRLLTMMVVPLMSCSARLPVYALLVGALFPPSEAFGLVPVQGLLMVGMYIFSTVMTLAAAYVLGRTVVRGRSVPLILELPRYRWPSWPTTIRMMFQRSLEFLTEAGTVILTFTIILWALLSFPTGDTTVEAPGPPTATTASSDRSGASHGTEPESPTAASPIERSYAGQLGKALEPVMSPLGFDWKITVGIIGAFSAREVFISTMGLVFGLEDTDDEALPLRDKMRAETRPDGKPAYPPLVGLSLMVFFALACQCMSTVAVVRRETRSWTWPALLVVYMTVLAYVVSLVVYQGGRLLGFAG